MPSPTRRARLFLAAAVAAVALVAPERPGRAVGPATTDTSPVVARVGPITITSAELERRLAMLPGFQLRAIGATPEEIKRRFLEHVLVHDALLSLGGEDRALSAHEDVRERLRGVLRNAMINRIKLDVATGSHIEEKDIRAFYEQNAAKFRTPERLALWMIVTQKREEALEVLDELKKDSSPKHWTELARERSIERSSGMRGGNLGYVSPDGTTPEPGYKVSQAILEAASKVKDTEIVPDPVEDGHRWAVVWRRQSMKAVERPMELEAGQIKQMLLRLSTEARIKQTIARLRGEHLGEHNPELLDLFEITSQGELAAVRRPGSLPAGKRILATPVPSPQTLR
jgi:peptidyl-prolyl cis-trans isomerase C